MATSAEIDKKLRIKRDAASGEHPYGDMGQMICLVVFLILWILDFIVFRLSTFLAQYIPSYIRWTAAAAAFALAVCLIRNGHRMVPDEAHDSEHLVKDGAFAHVRHPLYGESLLVYLSLILGSFSLVSLVAFGVIFLFYNAIASYEEKILDKKFGQEYRVYKQTVPKWIPRLKLYVGH